MFNFANLNNIILNPKQESYKVFGINYLTNLVCDYSLRSLKEKYRPPKNYISDFQLVKRLNKEYYEEQLFLNPFLQIKYFINEAIDYYKKLFVVQVFEDNCEQERIYNSKEFYNKLIPRIYHRLIKIYKYRNNLYLNDFKIDGTKIDADDLNPESLELIYKVKPNYLLDTSEKLAINMSDDHPCINWFKDDVKYFTIYLMEYQMNFNNFVYDLCWKYLHDFIISDLNLRDPKVSKEPKAYNKTYFINPNNKFKVIESKSKNKFGFITNLNSYYELKTIYKFRNGDVYYELNLPKLEPKFNVKLEDIYKFAKNKYGSVLNFGAEYFYIPYFDFIDEYELVL